MEQIIQVLEDIQKEALHYQEQLKPLQEDFETTLLSPPESGTTEDRLKHQKNAYNLLNNYLKSQISAVDAFKEEWDLKERLHYLKNYDAHSITNGKFYDYAVGHFAWRGIREDLYQLLESKIELFIQLKQNLKQLFRANLVENYRQNLVHVSPELNAIIIAEEKSGNTIIEVSASEYVQFKVFFKFSGPFTKDYKKDFQNLQYKNVNDPHYWNEEYTDHFTIVASGF